MSPSLSELTIKKAQELLSQKEVSAVELAEEYLRVIAEKDGGVHAYLEVFDDVKAEAHKADEKRAQGERGALLGIPLAIKDNILIKGKRAGAASKILESYTATYDATVTEKLKKDGAIFLGRTNMDEFAMGSSTENSAYGVTKNPRDVARVPGGSSGGSAAAVAGGMAIAALGSDTGGSIRQPAALCGLVGLKPTYGSVSRFGLMALGSSLDQIGPLTKSVEDCRILFDAIMGHDSRDSTTLPEAPGAAAKSTYRIGVPRHFLERGVDKDVQDAFEKTLERLEGEGHAIVDVELRDVSYGLNTYYVIMPAEASANLARFDGTRYGFYKEGSSGIDDYAQTRGSGLGKEVRRRILLGTYVLSAGYYDAYYTTAQNARRLLTKEFMDTLSRVDVIATPTTPSPAFKIGSKADPLSMYAEDIFTVPANLTGLPAISVPMGEVLRDGVSLPVGIQFTAPLRHEASLFSLGEAVEKSRRNG